MLNDPLRPSTLELLPTYGSYALATLIVALPSEEKLLQSYKHFTILNVSSINTVEAIVYVPVVVGIVSMYTCFSSFIHKVADEADTHYFVLVVIHLNDENESHRRDPDW